MELPEFAATIADELRALAKARREEFEARWAEAQDPRLNRLQHHADAFEQAADLVLAKLRALGMSPKEPPSPETSDETKQGSPSRLDFLEID